MGQEVFFTTNPSDWTRLEGLYVTELKGPGFIKGIDTQVVAIAGKAVRGPTTPKKYTNTGRILEVLGGRDLDGDGATGLYSEIWRALLNKPFGSVVLRRVAADDAVAASFTLETAAGGGGTAVLKVEASSVGLWGAYVKIKVEAPSDGGANTFNLRVRYQGEDTLYENLDISTGQDNTLTVVAPDDANLIVLTKLADGEPVTTGMAGLDSDGFLYLGQTVASFTSIAASDGTIADADYVTAMDDIAAFAGASVAFVAEAVPTSQAVLNAEVQTLAASMYDRLLLTWSGEHDNDVSTEVTAIGAQITTPSDRIVWCFNSAKIIDPTTGGKIDAPAHHFMASILSQQAVNVHPGAEECKAQAAAIVELYNETLSRGDLIELRDAGISTLEHVTDGFTFHSGVCTDGSEIVDRRQRDYMQLSAAAKLKSYVKQPDSRLKTNLMISVLKAFSETCKSDEFIVEDYKIVVDGLNPKTGKVKGLKKVLWKVKFIDHDLFLVLLTDMGTGVIIDQGMQAA